MEEPADQVRSRGRRGLRTSTLLGAVAVVPLLGLLLVGWQSADGIREESAKLEAIDEAADAAVDIARIQAAVADEMVWSAVDVAVVSAGIPPEALDPIFEGEASELLVDAEARVDSALAAAGRPEIVDAVESARAVPLDLVAVLAAYAEVLDTLDARFDGALQRLFDAAGDSSSDFLPESVWQLGTTVELREILVAQFYGFYASQFDVRNSREEEIKELITLQSRYDETVGALRGNPAIDPALLAALDVLESAPDFLEFTRVIDDTVSGAFGSGERPPPPGELTLEVALENFEVFAPILRTVELSSGITDEMRELTTEAVTAEVQQIRQAAQAEIRRTYALVITLALLSLATVVLITRLIVRPLRALQDTAHQLQSSPGDPVPSPHTGPSEVRDAADAISDAALHLRLAAQQADALAAGELDAPVLDEELGGGLGSALQLSVGVLRDSMAQQEEFRRRLAHEAAHDGLTQLPNRTTTMARLDRSIARTSRSSGRVAVLFVDLDGFKDINDLHGHHGGDAALKVVAERLAVSVREGDEVGRLGGDEFLVIAEPVSGAAEAARLAGRIVAELARPISIPGASVTLGASIGVALAQDGHMTADELVRDADLALYRAKEGGRGSIELCTDELRSQVAQTSTIASGIRRAISHGELLMHYQPIVAADTHRAVAVEALVRWQRPGEEELVSPAEFIGVAERSSLIIDVDLWVLDTVARQISAWSQEQPDWEFAVCVNLSARHLASARFTDDVLEALAAHGVDAGRLVVEITEGALVDDVASAALKLQRLRDEGVAVSIDDFGTGYTALAHLRSLPFDVLKIDRTFAGYAAERPYEASVSKLIIDAGHLLGAKVIAEGLETAEEVEELTRLGADELQGFYFGEPQPADRIAEMIMVSGADRV